MKKKISICVLGVVLSVVLIWMANMINWQMNEMVSLQERIYNIEVIVNYELRANEQNPPVGKD